MVERKLSTHEKYVLLCSFGIDVFTPAFPAIFVQGNSGYDVIIVDSSDPVGPAESLFQPVFYQVRFWRVMTRYQAAW